MSIFRRHKHTWEVRAVLKYGDREWYDGLTLMNGSATDILYVCSECKADTRRTEAGQFTLAQAKDLFPRP